VNPTIGIPVLFHPLKLLTPLSRPGILAWLVVVCLHLAPAAALGQANAKPDTIRIQALYNIVISYKGIRGKVAKIHPINILPGMQVPFRQLDALPDVEIVDNLADADFVYFGGNARPNMAQIRQIQAMGKVTIGHSDAFTSKPPCWGMHTIIIKQNIPRIITDWDIARHEDYTKAFIMSDVTMDRK